MLEERLSLVIVKSYLHLSDQLEELLLVDDAVVISVHALEQLKEAVKELLVLRQLEDEHAEKEFGEGQTNRLRCLDEVCTG